MTQYIGNVPLRSIQNIDKSHSIETDELDVIDSSSNIILQGNDEGRNMEIEFTLLKRNHPEQLDVEEQRDDLKSLVSNDASNNYFEYDDTEYFLSIENISFPEEATVQNIREGTISAKALPWPKKFPDARTGNDKLTRGDLLFKIDLEADYSTVSEFVSGEVNFKKDIEGEMNSIERIFASLMFSFNLESESFKIHSSSGETIFSLDMETISDLKHSSVGFLDFKKDINGVVFLLNSFNGNVSYTLNIEGELEIRSGQFGQTQFGEQQFGE